MCHAFTSIQAFAVVKIPISLSCLYCTWNITVKNTNTYFQFGYYYFNFFSEGKDVFYIVKMSLVPLVKLDCSHFFHNPDFLEMIYNVMNFKVISLFWINNFPETLWLSHKLNCLESWVLKYLSWRFSKITFVNLVKIRLKQDNNYFFSQKISYFRVTNILDMKIM